MKTALGLACVILLAGCQGQPAKQVDKTVAAATPASSPSAGTPVLAAPAKAVACTARETLIFSCTFKDTKRVAVCGSAPGKAEYRFGGGTPELVLSGGENAYAMYSGGGESQLAFTNGDTRYIVFSRMVRTGFDEDGNKPAMSDGVVIERNGKFVAMRLCESDLKPVDPLAAEVFLSSGDRDLFTDGTIRADPAGNE